MPRGLKGVRRRHACDAAGVTEMTLRFGTLLEAARSAPASLMGAGQGGGRAMPRQLAPFT
jgi:hypothetical protein